MVPIVLTPHQCDAVSFLTDHLQDGDAIVALRGLAGTGKTSLIPTLINVLEESGIPVTLGAPTHRAAMVLKSKGLTQADTVHSHALTPYFTGDYAKAVRWLGGNCQCKPEEFGKAQLSIDGVPWLIAERLKVTGHSSALIQARARRHDAKKALESIGLYGRKYFDGFGPKECDGVLIIDEASMVGSDMLALCQQAFPQLCLIGDPGQLPPVKDAAILTTVSGFDLTEIHRQAKDSPIVQLAYAAREGTRFWQRLQQVPGQLEEHAGLGAAAFLTAPLIVWRNTTRITCTLAIREALGFPPEHPQCGEPLVCRSSDPKARADGFYNNALFRVVSIDEANPHLVTVQPDGNEEAETHEVLAHMEEVDGDNLNPEAILFRYGYCLTAHTAQGGEWPAVYISKPDLFAHSKRSEKEQDNASFRQWTYTAITRAKQTLGFLTKHDFAGTIPGRSAPQPWILPPDAPADTLIDTQGETMPRMQQEHKDAKIAPPSAPFLGMPELSMPQPEPDDVPDPPAPEGVTDDAVNQDIPGLPGLSGPITPHVNGATVPLATLADLEQAAHDALHHALQTADIHSGHEALLHGFCEALQKRLATSILAYDKSVMLTMDMTLGSIKKWIETTCQANEHSQYQLSDALLKLQDPGLMVRGTPYEMALAVVSQAGIPITLTIRQTSAEALIDELGRLEGWLAAHGYTGQTSAALVTT